MFSKVNKNICLCIIILVLLSILLYLVSTKSVKEGWGLPTTSTTSSSLFRFNNLKSYYTQVLTKSKQWRSLFRNYERDINKFKNDNPNYTNEDLDTFYEDQLNMKVKNRTKKDILKGLAWSVIKNKLSNRNNRKKFYKDAIDYVGSQLNLQHRI